MLNKNKFWAGVLLAQFVIFFIFSKIPDVIIFFEKWFNWQKNIHLNFFSIFPFPIGDIFYFLFGLFSLYTIIKAIKKGKKYFVSFLIVLNIFYFLYQIFWGMLYFQTPIANQLKELRYDIDDLKKLSLKYLDFCEQSRKQVKVDENGVFKVHDIEGIKNEIRLRQTVLPQEFNSKSPIKIDNIKPSLYGKIMNFTGILGYYNPFTSEAQYNSELPSTYQPFTMAHESAHQLGFAREQEANFIAYFLGKDSNNMELRYCTEWFVLKNLLNTVSKEDENFVNEILLKMSAGLQNDYRYEVSFQEKHSGLLASFFGFTNDLFLKSNQQDGSITYSYFIDLLVRYELSYE